jgi:adenylate cyclase
MDDAQFHELADFVTESGLLNRTETDLVNGFCDRVVASGLPLARVSIVMDTLHPVYEGRAVNWRRVTGSSQLSQYGRSETGEVSDSWLRSPFRYLLENKQTFMRRKLAEGSESEFKIFKELRELGLTDYIAMAHPFKDTAGDGMIDGIVSSWSTDSNRGFSDPEIDELQRLVPLLTLALKTASLNHIANTLVETYLGRDAGRRVLRGHIARGTEDRMETVLWFSDLRGFTRIADSVPPDQLIPLPTATCRRSSMRSTPMAAM